jgi:hypothetical protein
VSDHDYPEGPLGPQEITAESPYTLPGFFDALSAGRLLGIECRDCDAVLVPPRPACHACGSRRVGIAELPRTGEVYSYTEVVRPPTAFEHLAPLTVAIVELDSGARLTGRVDAAYDDVEIGTPVELAIREPDVDPEALLSYERDWPFHVFTVQDGA